MGKAAALPNAHFTEVWLHCTLNARGGCRLGKSVWIGHNSKFYAERMSARGAPARQPVWRPALQWIGGSGGRDRRLPRALFRVERQIQLISSVV